MPESVYCNYVSKIRGFVSPCFKDGISLCRNRPFCWSKWCPDLKKRGCGDMEDDKVNAEKLKFFYSSKVLECSEVKERRHSGHRNLFTCTTGYENETCISSNC